MRELSLDLGTFGCLCVEVIAPGPHPHIDGAIVDDASADGSRYVASHRQALLHLSDIATFLVEDGDRVTVQVDPNCDLETAAQFLNASVLSLVLAQRGVFALHANAVSVDGKAIIIMGDRGAGKSTTAALLGQRGHHVIADDVSPLVFDEDRAVLRPTARSLRLPRSTVEALGLASTPADWDTISDKLLVPLSVPEPVTVASVVALVVDDEADEVRSERVAGLHALRLLEEHIYRVELLRPVMLADLFRWVAAVVERVPVRVVRRPARGWSVDRVADAIIDGAAEC